MEEPDATVDGSEILHHLIGSSSHYLPFFLHPRWLALGFLYSSTVAARLPDRSRQIRPLIAGLQEVMEEAATHEVWNRGGKWPKGREKMQPF